MSLDKTAGENQIYQLLVDNLPTVDIHQGEYVPVSQIAVKDENGLVKPYVNVSYASMSPGYQNGIVNSKYDILRNSVRTYCVAATDKASRSLLGKVMGLLIGFEPEDGSEIRLQSGYSFLDADMGTNRYVQTALFTYFFNLDS